MREVTATVVSQTEIANEIFSLTFTCGEVIPVRAGQFCMLGVNGFPLRRPFAICMAEGETLTVCYRVRGNGTKALSALKAGDTLPALLPLGNGYVLKDSQKKIALVGGGVGIFPLVSVIREYADRELYSYMGFRNRAALCMERELHKSNVTFASDDGSFGFCGSSVQAFARDLKEGFDAVVACGPAPMLKALKEVTSGLSIPVYVSLEERMGCGMGACLACTVQTVAGAPVRVCKDGPVFEIGEIVL